MRAKYFVCLLLLCASVVHARTSLVQDIRPGNNVHSNPQNLINCLGSVFFTAESKTHFHWLWKTNGTTAGTVRLANVVYTPGNFACTGNMLLFSAYTPQVPRANLWKSNGTVRGTVRF